jgi:hypothetical protein
MRQSPLQTYPCSGLIWYDEASSVTPEQWDYVMQIERLDVSAICGGPTAVLDAIRDEIAMTPGRPDVRYLMTIGERIVKAKLSEYAYNAIYPRIEAVYTMYALMNGPYPQQHEKSDRAFLRAQADEWSSGLDDQIEKLFDEYNGIVSADFIGEVCAGNRLWEPDAITTLAGAFAKDAVRIATWHAGKDHGGPKTPAQLMAAVGLVENDFRDFANTRIEPTEQEMEIHQMNSLADAISRIHTVTSMMGLVGAALKAQLDNASDDDDGLAHGWVKAIGGDPGDVPALRTARKQMGLDGLCTMIENGSYGIVSQEFNPVGATVPSLPPPPPPPVAAPAAQAVDLSMFGLPSLPLATPANTAQAVVEKPINEPERAPPKKRGPKNASAENPQAMPPRMLVIARDFTGLNSQQLGELFGCARQSYENYAKGKGVLVPTPEQRAQFRGMLEQHITNLREALHMLDQVDTAAHTG